MPQQPAPVASDIGLYPAPHLAVDLVLLTLHDHGLAVLMHERSEAPYAGQLVLPGGFVHPGECLDDTARRVLRTKAGLTHIAVEQLYTFSAPDRDPRGWVVSAAYFALVPYAQLLADHGGLPGAPGGLRLVQIAPCASGEAGRVRSARQRRTVLRQVELRADGKVVEPGFDHQAIVTTAVERLRGKLDWSMVAFALLPERFTLYALQRVHEAILGHPLNKSQFRKRMLERPVADGRRLVATGELLRGGRQRPAELYELAGSPA